MGDRTGSREPKLSSLKKSKKNPGAPSGRTKRERKVESAGLSLSAPPPLPSASPYFDCAMALLSRQFERDRDKVVERARSEGVCAILCWFSDIEKLDLLLETCKSHSGLCYLLAGIHPDNIERTNKKSHEGWMHKVEEVAKHPVCVGILSGLNLSREIGTHFAQESLLTAACSVADRVLLPLVLHIAPDGSSLERAIEILREEGWTTDSEAFVESGGRRRIILHDAITACGSDIDKINIAVAAGFYFIFSAVGLTDADPLVRDRARACVAAVPCQRIMSGSDSPWRTPQNLSDTYLRTLRNEPCNMQAVVKALADAAAGDTSVPSFEAMLRSTAITVFGLDSIADVAGGAVEAEEGVSISAPTGDLPVIVEVVEDISAPGMVKRRKDKKKGGKHMLAAVTTECVDESEESDNEGDEVEGGVHAGAAAVESGLVPSLELDEATEPYFGCQRCRCRLFSASHVRSHGLEATRTVFKVGEEGLCTAAVFVPCSDATALSRETRLVITGNTLECSVCSCKLGKYSAGDASCPCGAVVGGPTARVVTSKVDYFDGSQDTASLIARSRKEAEEAQLQTHFADADADAEKHLKKDKKKKKISRLDNRGNFSNFRNKTFVPNASRSTSKRDAETSDDVGVDVATLSLGPALEDEDCSDDDVSSENSL